MELQLRGRFVPGGPCVCAVAGSQDAAAESDAAVRAGAVLLDLGRAGQEAVATARARQPEVFICAEGGGAAVADLTPDPAVAARTGAGLICGSREAALASGAARDAVLIAAAPAQVAALAEDGWAVLVDTDSAAAGEAGAVAVAAVGAWAGARVLRTRNVTAVREAIDMVESIRGTRPPSRATRGLA